MPIGDLVFNSDLAHPPYGCDCGKDGGSDDKKCNCNSAVYFLPPPQMDISKFPLYPPYPYYPPCPCPPHHHHDGNDDSQVKQNSIEKKICKKSKEAATLRQLIENLETKNKNLIVKAGSVSYNMGAYKTTDPDDPDVEITSEDIESVIDILKAKLETVKEEIKELSEELGE